MSSGRSSIVRVAIAVLRAEDGRLLVRRRRSDEHLPDVWEFPGGKVREGEDPRQAAAREALEELGVEASELRSGEEIEHDYGDRTVRIYVFEGACAGEPRASDGAEWRWVAPAQLAELPIPPANHALVARLVGESARRRVR